MTKKGKPINVLIVDDEKEACDNLNNIITRYIDAAINIQGIAHDTTQAEKLIEKFNPDAIFLDIEMPDENAFQFLKRIYPYNFEIIFVTAYDEFAIKAFKLNAVDYIQKPICIEELEDAISKLHERISYRSFIKYKDHQLDTVEQIANREDLQKITLKSLNHIEIVDFKAIYAIEGQGNYCRICFSKDGVNKEITTSNILAYYEELLPKDLFYRIHKSYLVNCLQIESIISGESSSVMLKNKDKIPVSRRRYPDFIRFIKENRSHSA